MERTPAWPNQSAMTVGRPRARAFARRSDHQAASGRRAGAKAHVHRDHRRTARGLPAVRGRPRPHPGSPAGAGQVAHPTQAGARRQGVRLPEEPCLPAPPRDPMHHPGQGRPGPQSQSAARAAAGHRSSTRRITRRGTRSSAASIASRGTGPSPRGTTSSRSVTRRPYSSRPSTSDCEQHLAGPVVFHRFSASNAWATARLSS